MVSDAINDQLEKRPNYTIFLGNLSFFNLNSRPLKVVRFQKLWYRWIQVKRNNGKKRPTRSFPKLGNMGNPNAHDLVYFDEDTRKWISQ